VPAPANAPTSLPAWANRSADSGLSTGLTLKIVDNQAFKGLSTICWAETGRLELDLPLHGPDDFLVFKFISYQQLTYFIHSL
jgi:hypothetical protein